MSLEKMDEFFAARVEGYDAHMLNNVEGCKEGYKKMAGLIPCYAETLLDLGCGTGLELDEIFKTKPTLSVTGIDLTQAMLDKLREKHPDRNLTLINQSYFDYDFGKEKFDAAVSFQTMHHFSHEEKVGLYARVCDALKNNGMYIECDYMVIEQEEEDFYYSENKRLRKELGIPDGDFYHYDTPCTMDNQIKIMLQAGFSRVEKKWRQENTTIMAAYK